MQDESIFTKIIKGEIPADKIYEDERTYAFLDIRPTQPGHTLVVPKQQIDYIWDLPDEDYHALWAAAKKIAKHLKTKLNVQRVGIKVEGLEVPHAHIHLIPFNTAAEFRAMPDLQAQPDKDALKHMADKLKLEDV